MSIVTSKERAGYAAAAIERYIEAKAGRTLPYDTLQTIFTDLLCDLMHYARRSGIDFEDTYSTALSHYTDEEMERHMDLVHELPSFIDALKKARDELQFLQNTGARGANDTETREALHLITQAIAKAEGDAS